MAGGDGRGGCGWHGFFGGGYAGGNPSVCGAGQSPGGNFEGHKRVEFVAAVEPGEERRDRRCGEVLDTDNPAIGVERGFKGEEAEALTFERSKGTGAAKGAVVRWGGKGEDGLFELVGEAPGVEFAGAECKLETVFAEVLMRAPWVFVGAGG